MASRLPLAAVALTAYDPSYDPDNQMLDVGLDLISQSGHEKAWG